MKLVLLILSFFILTACNSDVERTQDNVTIEPPQTGGTEEKSPTYFYLGLTAGTNPAGGFNGGGIGNKAYLGLTDYNNKLVSSFSSISFDSMVPNSNAQNRNAYINFTIDLNCDENNRDYAIVITDYMVSSAGTQGSWNTYSFTKNDNVFKSVGGKGGLPNHFSATGGPLTTLTTNFPGACFVNDNSGDGGHKKDTDTSGVLFILGDSGTVVARTIYLDNISVDIDGVKEFTFEAPNRFSGIERILVNQSSGYLEAAGDALPWP